MAVVATNNNKVVTEGKVKTPKLRYTLGDSELYFEPAQYLTAITGMDFLPPRLVANKNCNGIGS